MDHIEQQPLIDKIYTLIERNELTLPTLPDVAINIRKLIDDPNVSADQIVTLVSSDPAITSQIMRTANSAPFVGKPPVENVREAITRLGYKQLRNVVLTVTMSELLQASSPVVKRHMVKYWEHSREVAAVSFVLALHQKHLNPDQAMLAGLIHEIGVIPLCMSIDRTFPTVDEQTLDSLLCEFHVEVGSRLLQSWNFPQDMIDVIAGHEDLHRASSTPPLADYVDVVTVANLQDRVIAKIAAWENIAATQRLGMTPQDCQNFLERFAQQLEIVHNMLGINTDESRPYKAIHPAPQSASRPGHHVEQHGSLLTSIMHLLDPGKS
ncbi:MAG: HDOD domain-containing protein [Sideroxydans sp.]|nr:HDOD domain-containing protein [Sideroxydans sp.]